MYFPLRKYMMSPRAASRARPAARALGPVASGVAANSARNAWAVGTVNSGGLVVILRWNGTRWVNFESANALL